jgi:SHS family lactate transporter-like MFS transporter
LNELSPQTVRGTFPGLAYQLGNQLASRNSVVQSKLAEHYFDGNFAPVLALTALLVSALVVIVTIRGHEAKGANLSDTG